MRTVAAPRPPRLYSVLSTTIGSLPCMMTLPARISWASFIADSVGVTRARLSNQERGEAAAQSSSFYLFRLDEAQQLGGQVLLREQAFAPRPAGSAPGRPVGH